MKTTRPQNLMAAAHVRSPLQSPQSERSEVTMPIKQILA